MKSIFTRISILILALGMGVSTISAQNSFGAPGSGGGASNSLPAPGTGGAFNPGPPSGGPGPVWGGGPSYGPGWSSWNGPIYTGTPLSSPYWANSGVEAVVGAGYDVTGVYRLVPMHVSYQYNGINYNVTVLNAYNPLSQMWSYAIDMPAYSTYYYMRGEYYNYYSPLSFGTFYFNL